MNSRTCLFSFWVILLYLFIPCTTALAQTEVQAWGNITGMRVDDELFRFESSIRVVYDENWRRERATGRERNWTTYRREGATQIVRTHMDSLFFEETVKDEAPGIAKIKIKVEPEKDRNITGAFFHLALPAKKYATSNLLPVESASLNLSEHNPVPVGDNELMRVFAKGISLKSAQREFTVTAGEATMIIVKKDPATGDLGLYFTLHAGQVQNGEGEEQLFTIAVAGKSEAEVAHLKLFPQYPGNEFLGLGGNFRLQNAKTDPPVINYALQNLDVRMGRVEMPWELWHAERNKDPLAEARKGNIHPHVKASMEMAKRLHDMGMPVLLAGWFPPGWAAEGIVKRNPRHPDGTFGNPLRQDRAEEIYESITSYILYMKEAYGVEVAMFSFNESDLGINVRQTAEEHAMLIKGLGAYMRSKGLNTKFLLGDTADANGFAFLDVALDDPETWEYIGMVSFHSWRGWEKETLLEWYEAADRLNVPLIIGEGSIDAAAWRYPQIFEESHYAMEEIKLYIRILAISQPKAILQWQLTADYSPLKGGGVFGNDSMPLQPTQRFWNLKQLSATPPGLHIMPVTNDNEELYVTALGDKEQKKLAFHLVNEGQGREVVLTGLPANIKNLRMYITDKEKGMEKGKRVKIKDGEARFNIKGASFVSLMTELEL